MSPARFTLFAPLSLAVGCVLGPGDWEIWDQIQDSGPGQTDSDTTADDTGGSGTETGDSVPSDTGPLDTAMPAPELHGVTPSFGPRGGGSAVTIRGAQLSADAVVHFGGAVATVGSASDQSIVVTTPAYGTASTVDVTLAQASGDALLAGGYRYLDLDDASGLVAAKGALQWFDHRGSYWAPEVQDYGLVQLWFPGQPDSGRYRDLFAPGLDSCTSDQFEVDSRGGMDLSGVSAVLSGELGTIEPVWDVANTRFELELGAITLEESTSYALTLGGLWDLPDFTIADLAATPAPFELTSPDIAGSAPLALEQDQLAFRWQTIEADAVVIYIARVSGDGRETFEVLSCLVDNDGAFTIPPSAWEAWQGGNQLYTYVGAMREVEATVPLNNGISSVAGISWNVGVILTR